MRHLSLARTLLVGALIAVLGCTGDSGRATAIEVAERFGVALVDGDDETLRAIAHDRCRDDLDQIVAAADEVAALVAALDADDVAVAARLRSTSDSSAQVTLELEMKSAGTPQRFQAPIELTEDGDEWVLSSCTLDFGEWAAFPGASTPPPDSSDRSVATDRRDLSSTHRRVELADGFVVWVGEALDVPNTANTVAFDLAIGYVGTEEPADPSFIEIVYLGGATGSSYFDIPCVPGERGRFGVRLMRNGVVRAPVCFEAPAEERSGAILGVRLGEHSVRIDPAAERGDLARLELPTGIAAEGSLAEQRRAPQGRDDPITVGSISVELPTPPRTEALPDPVSLLDELSQATAPTTDGQPTLATRVIIEVEQTPADPRPAPLYGLVGNGNQVVLDGCTNEPASAQPVGTRTLCFEVPTAELESMLLLIAADGEEAFVDLDW